MGAIRTPTGEQAGGAAQPPWRRSAAERKRVLVVEDSEHDREVYGRVLLYNGFDVIFAGTGAQALERARTHRPDLILLDILLPDAHGLELCTPLRKAGGEVPVVLLTALSEEDFGARARQAGCAGFIEKPASPVAVLHQVEIMLGTQPLSGEDPLPRVLAG